MEAYYSLAFEDESALSASVVTRSPIGDSVEEIPVTS